MNQENKEEVTVSSLKNMVWGTLQDLRDRRIKPDMANAITKGSNAIISIVKLEVEVAKMLNSNTTGLTNFIETEGVQPKTYLSTEEQEVKALEGQDVQTN